MREIAFEMFESLIQEDSKSFGRLMNENWECQKALHPSITNERIEEIFEVVRQGDILGGKACGAGGGGGLLFLVEPERRNHVAEILSNLSGVIVQFKFDREGLIVERRV